MSRQLILVCAFVVLSATVALGHAPKQVAADFDDDSKVLSVTVMHDVKDAVKHYVNSISVELNGKETIKQTFLAQESLEKQAALYRIVDARPGDEIKVTAGCNISGKKSVTVKVEAKAAPEGEEGAGKNTDKDAGVQAEKDPGK